MKRFNAKKDETYKKASKCYKLSVLINNGLIEKTDQSHVLTAAGLEEVEKIKIKYSPRKKTNHAQISS